MNQQIQKRQASALDRAKVALAHGAHAIDSGDVSELIQELERKLESAENQRDKLLDALERIESTVPGRGDGGGFVFDHYDHEGEYIGSQNMEGENLGDRPVKAEIPDGKIKRNIEMLKKHGLYDDPLSAGIVAIAMANIEQSMMDIYLAECKK